MITQDEKTGKSLSPEQNILQNGFWVCFWMRVKKLVLDIIHIRSVIFWIGTALAVRFMTAYLNVMDKTPNPYLGISVVGVWFMLAIGVGWNRTWEDVWSALCELLKNYNKKKE